MRLKCLTSFLLLSFIVLVLLSANSNKRYYNGIDISHHQKHINWAEVAKDKNIKYIYIKATEGKNHVDSLYAKNIKGARNNGFKVGSYHYFKTTSSAREQFENFKRTAKKEDQDLIPILDVEELKGWSKRQLRDSIKVFIRLTKQHYGKAPIIYSGHKFYNNHLCSHFNNYHLMIARYGQRPPRLNGKKGTYSIWQYTDKGKVKGIDEPVDLSRFNPKYSLNTFLLE
ncbi:lysozyme [Dysgonomonadaceae bacterium PH5-43]|nr:lysozyme [Dysgonomonadaceae bacterium PH5-43]